MKTAEIKITHVCKAKGHNIHLPVTITRNELESKRREFAKLLGIEYSSVRFNYDEK